jgi:hypothetical protein
MYNILWRHVTTENACYFEVKNKSLELLCTGVSLLATHRTMKGVKFLYHIPKYLPFEFPGLKKPISKVPPLASVSPSLMY